MSKPTTADTTESTETAYEKLYVSIDRETAKNYAYTFNNII